MRALGSRRFQVALLSVVLGSFTLTNLPPLDEPFLLGHEGFNGASFATSTRKTSRFGLLATKATPTPSYFGETPPQSKDFYASTPCGYPLLLTATYVALVIEERTGRCLSLAFCIGLITGFYLFGYAHRRGPGRSCGRRRGSRSQRPESGQLRGSLLARTARNASRRGSGGVRTSRRKHASPWR